MVPEFRLQLRRELEARDLLDAPGPREACAERARVAGERALTELQEMAGTLTVRKALSLRRGPEFAQTYRYVIGYGQLMTRFLTAPVPLDEAACDRVVRLGGIANLIVSHFDELVDGGWPRALLLPRWALAIAPTSAGRAAFRLGAVVAPPPTRLTLRLVADYFRRVAELPYVMRHAKVRADLRRTIVAMYLEEGRTPREQRRRRGDAARQKKTALPLVVLGQAAWLASPECPPALYRRHHRWLVRMGKFIRWIDDAADLTIDRDTGSANVVRRALAGRGVGADARLAAGIARRGRRLVDEWRELTGRAGKEVSAEETALRSVLAAVLVAWVGCPEPGLRPEAHRHQDDMMLSVTAVSAGRGDRSRVRS